MEELIVKLMVAAALVELGLAGRPFTVRELEVASRKITAIDWKPISIFPEEAKRFR